MNTGQMLTVLGALLLLSMVSLAINSMITEKTILMYENEASLNAISIAQTMIDEILTKSYDAATAPPYPAIYPADATKVYDVNSFTAPTSLGPNYTEASNVPLPDVTTPFRSISKYNDVDDYHRYRRIVSTPRMGNFTVIDSVYYVNENNPEQKSSVRTYFKKIVVTVTHPNMRYPLQLSDVAVYRRYF